MMISAPPGINGPGGTRRSGQRRCRQGDGHARPGCHPEVRARRHGRPSVFGTGELMARHLRGGRPQDGSRARNAFVTWLSLGAGDGNRICAVPGLLCGLTCGAGCPRVTVRDRPVTGVNGQLMAQRSPGMTCVSRVETDCGRRSKTRPHLQLGSWSSGSVQAGPTPVTGHPWTPPHGC